MAERQELAPMPREWRRALAIVAHPDDMEYGAAGAVAEWTEAGHEVAYLLVTRGEAGIDNLPPEESGRVREAEQRASAAVVGVERVDFLDHSDGVIEEGIALRRDLTAAVRRYRPELLLTLTGRDTWGPGWWNTPDHRAVGRAVLDAAGDAGNRWIFPEQLAGERGLRPWGGVRWVAAAGSYRPTHAVEVSARSLERAIASLAEHRAYITGLGADDPRGYARRLITEVTDGAAERYGLRRPVVFEVFHR